MFEYYFPADDAIIYFTNKASGFSVAEFAETTKKAHPSLSSEIRRILHPAVELERILDASIGSCAKLDFYFRLDPTFGGELIPLMNPAWLIFGYRAGMGDGGLPLRELAKRRLGLSIAEKERLFKSYLSDLAGTDAPFQTNPAEDPRDLFVVMRDMELPAEIRIRLIELYTNFDEYVPELVGILEPVVKLIEANAALYETPVLALEREIASTPGGIGGYMQKMHNFTVNERGSHLPHPCLLAPNMINIHDGLFDGMDIYIGVGVRELMNSIYAGSGSKKLVSICKTLADETRLEILHCICERPMYGLEIAEAFSVSAPTVSYHMNKLVINGLCDSYFSGGKSYYRANFENLAEFVRALSHYLGESPLDKNEPR